MRKAIAVIGVFVGDEDGVQLIECAADGGEAGEGFTLAEAGVDEDAGAFRFKERQVAGTAGRQNGNTQADGNSPGKGL